MSLNVLISFSLPLNHVSFVLESPFSLAAFFYNDRKDFKAVRMAENRHFSHLTCNLILWCRDLQKLFLLNFAITLHMCFKWRSWEWCVYAYIRSTRLQLARMGKSGTGTEMAPWLAYEGAHESKKPCRL